MTDAEPAAPVRIIRDLLYAAHGDRALCADVFLPAMIDEPPPVIVWLHGGGWRFGSRRVAPDLSRFFAAQGLAMIAVDYRSSRRARFPAQIEDVKTAIRWVRSVAQEYGFDARRVGLWGASAGGHLAALAALTGNGHFTPEGSLYSAHSSQVQAAVDGYGPTDFLQMDAHRPPPGTPSDDAETLPLPRPDLRSADPDSYESLLLGAPIGTCPELVRHANPIAYVHSGAPPFLILHGLSDMTIAPHQSELLYEALAASGNDATLCLIEGLGHGFLNRSHLDDGPPRRMKVREWNGEGAERRSSRTAPVFPLIETFFRRAFSSR